MKFIHSSSLLRSLAASLCFAVIGVCAQAQVTVLNHIDPVLNGSFGGISPSMYYGAAMGTSNDVGAVEDFTLSGATRITQVESLINFSTSISNYNVALGWQVNFYSSHSAALSSLAGDIASINFTPAQVTYTAKPDIFGVFNAGVLSLPVDVTFSTPGTFYVSVMAQTEYQLNGEPVRVYSGSNTGGNNGFYSNPDGPYGDYALGDVAYRISGVADGASAIPEPSTYAAIAGALTLGMAVIRRRLQAKAAYATAPASV